MLKNLIINAVFKVISRMLEWHMYALAYCMVALLYLQIVVSPLGICVLASLVSFEFFEPEQARIVVGVSSVLGLALGIFWAEHIRRHFGVIKFNAYLLSTPEIDGWRDNKGNVIKRR